MNRNALLAIAVAVVVAVPAVTAGADQLRGTDAQSAVETPQMPDDTSLETSGEAETTTEGRNYTSLYVDERYRSLDLKPGESETFTVTVENGESESVTIDPHVYVPELGSQPVRESWVDFGSGEVTLQAGEERSIDVTVAVPTDADLGQYQGSIAFTDERISYPGGPERPVNGVSFFVEVSKEPTVFVRSGSHGSLPIEAGTERTHSIEIENTGSESVSVDPQLETDEMDMPFGPSEDNVDRSWFTFDAPSEIDAGETETVNVTVEPPSQADPGHYSGTIDLGLSDPARATDRDHWQRVNLRVQVWKQPDEPYTSDFAVSESTEELRLEIDVDQMDGVSAHDKPAGVDVSLRTPAGEMIEPERVKVTDSGHVNVGSGDEGPRAMAGPVDNGDTTFTYRVADPAAGDWTAEFMPENTLRFGYEITRDERTDETDGSKGGPGKKRGHGGHKHTGGR